MEDKWIVSLFPLNVWQSCSILSKEETVFAVAVVFSDAEVI